MAYRNGTYIAFHAEGSTDPTASDIRYYRMLKAWHENDNVDFRFVNSHEKVAAVRDSSQAATIKRSLRERLNSSKNMVLIVGQRTRFDTDFVPYEIAYAVDTCAIPIIATYPGRGAIHDASALATLWPEALRSRIVSKAASVIHIPFNRTVIDTAINQFSHSNLPNGHGLGVYDTAAYRGWNIA